MIDWGVDASGRKRNPCPEDPKALAGAPIGMYHCPVCGEMQVAGMPHLPPEADYELVYGFDWPPGYEVTLKAYELPSSVLAKYICYDCGLSGVKLWRVAASSNIRGFCSSCGVVKAGIAVDDIDDAGRRRSEYGVTDQLWAPGGINLVPWVPAPDGMTWGYTSVPDEGVAWWRALPTRR